MNLSKFAKNDESNPHIIVSLDKTKSDNKEEELKNEERKRDLRTALETPYVDLDIKKVKKWKRKIKSRAKKFKEPNLPDEDA